ncbi:uncharacterized protein LOC142355906 isoform X2 [Convolutriloba macropyga]|uniref:uncharacterized protein LOC142355906 isoform X2 n=1 Tax=Convolutriloba macropyga TaxID=536237 RepID=UPI003F51FFF6
MSIVPVGSDAELLQRIQLDSYVDVFYAPMKKWFPAKVLKIDCNKCQIFVHYKGWKARFDEWLRVDSNVRMPPGQGSDIPVSNQSEVIDVASIGGLGQKTLSKRQSTDLPSSAVNSNIDVSEYKSGEMLLGQWKDGYKYVCFIQAPTDKGSYHVKFYDGSKGTVAASKLSPVTDIALKEYEQWKWEEEQIVEYKKKTGKRVKTYGELVQILKQKNQQLPASAITEQVTSLDLSASSVGCQSSTGLASSLNVNFNQDSEDGKYVCEEANCGKKFRKLTLLIHHTKHYHKDSTLVADESVSKSCSADVLAGKLKEERSVGEIAVKKRVHRAQEDQRKSSTGTSSLPNSPVKIPSSSTEFKIPSPSKMHKFKPTSQKMSKGKKKSFRSSFAAAFQLATTTLKSSVSDATSSADDEMEVSTNGQRKNKVVVSTEMSTDDKEDEGESDVFVVEGQGNHSNSIAHSSTIKDGHQSDGNQLPSSDSSTDDTMAADNNADDDSQSLSLMRFKSARSKLNPQPKQTSQSKSKVPFTANSFAGKLTCNLCGGSFASKKSYDKHLSIHGLTPESATDEIISEIKSNPTSPVKFASPTKNPTKPRLNKESKSQARPSVSDSTKSFTCPVCSQKFTTEDALKNHQKVRLHQVREETDLIEFSVEQPSEISADVMNQESKLSGTPQKSDFEVSFLPESLPNMAFKKSSSYASREGKLKRKKALVETLKRPKLAKLMKTDADVHQNEPSVKIDENVQPISHTQTIEVKKSEPEVLDDNFVPVFLDPPSSADESNESITADPPIPPANSTKPTGRNRLKPLMCPHSGCSQSFRKEAFLNLHVKHFHSSKKKKSAAAVETRKAVTFKKSTVPKIKNSSLGGRKKGSQSSKFASQDQRKPNQENRPSNVTAKLLPPSGLTDFKLKTPVKQNYNEILNESISLPTQPSPLTSDDDLDTSMSFNKVSVRDSPLKDGLKKILTFSRSSADSESNNESANSSPSKSRKRAHIDDSDMSDASGESEGWSGEVIRCVCDDSDIFGTMVQCNFCDSWLHGECLGVTEATLPDTYECPYCEAKKRVRKSRKLIDDSKGLELPNTHIGSSEDASTAVEDIFKKETDPWIAVTDQFARDFHHLQDMIRTLEVLNSIMKNPGHPEYPQLVLRFQHVLQTFNSDESKLEHCDLDPGVIKLLVELGEPASRTTSPVDFEESPNESRDNANSSNSRDENEQLENEVKQNVSDMEVENVGSNFQDRDPPRSSEMNRDQSVDSGVGPSHDLDDVDLNSSLEIDEEDSLDSKPVLCDPCKDPDEARRPISTWISPQKMRIEKYKSSYSGIDNEDVNDDVHGTSHQVPTKQEHRHNEIDLNQSLSLSSYKSNIELLYSMHKYEALEQNPLTSTQVETTLAGESLQPTNLKTANNSRASIVTDENLKPISATQEPNVNTDMKITIPTKISQPKAEIPRNETTKGSVKRKFDSSKPPRNIVEMVDRLIFQLEMRMDYLEQVFEQLESNYEQSSNSALSQLTETCLQSQTSSISNHLFDKNLAANFNISCDKMTERRMRDLASQFYLMKEIGKTTRT